MHEIGKGYRARIILDSINPVGCRLTTWELRYPRMVHDELLTHRLFSRNAASSRAIPNERLIAQVLDDPAMPVWWGKNQSGMQAREELSDERTAYCLRCGATTTLQDDPPLRCAGGHDFRSDRRVNPGLQDNFNRKGLISDQGVKKEAFFILQKAYKDKTLGKPE